MAMTDATTGYQRLLVDTCNGPWRDRYLGGSAFANGAHGSLLLWSWSAVHTRAKTRNYDTQIARL